MSNEVAKVKRETIAVCMTCPLCNNFYKQATTISECLHTFCRKCIYDKITDEDLECCPVCNIDLGCVPLEKLRLDHSKLNLRYILFPSKRREVKEPEVVAASVPLSAKRKEKCLSSLVFNTPRVSAQSTMTGRTKPTRKASSLRPSSPESSSSPETSNKLRQNNEQPQSSQLEIDLAKLTRVLNVPEQEKANTSVDDQNQQVNISKTSILSSSETLLELHFDTNLVNETSVDNQQVETQPGIIPDISQNKPQPQKSPQHTITPSNSEPQPINSNDPDVLSECNSLFRQIHGLHELRQSDMPSAEYAAKWVSLTEELVKELYRLQEADVKEQKSFDKNSATEVEEVIQIQKDIERNQPESSSVRASDEQNLTEKLASLEEDLNEPILDNLGANQEHLRNPVYEAEIESIKAEMAKYVGLMEGVNANQKEIMRILAFLCSQPQLTP